MGYIAEWTSEGDQNEGLSVRMDDRQEVLPVCETYMRSCVTERAYAIEWALMRQVGWHRRVYSVPACILACRDFYICGGI